MTLKLLLNPSEFLVSELQAAHIIKYKGLHSEEETTKEESEKEQRVEDHSHELAEFCQEYEDDDVSDKDQRKAEIQAEWILLLRALDMDTSSPFTDVLSEVSLDIRETGLCISHDFKLRSTGRISLMLF